VVELDALDLPAELRSSIESWMQRFNDATMEHKQGLPDEIKQAFDAEGAELGGRIQRVLPALHELHYVPIDSEEWGFA
jgi:hypothetical protein